MSTPHTREATENDVYVMEAIMRDSFEASYAHFMPEPYVRQFYDNNEAQKAVRSGLHKAGVAEIMGRVCGFVMTQDNIICELWVDPNYQKQGVGQALIEWTMEQFRAQGFQTISLYCYEDNKEALEFYKKMRFRKASTFMSQDVPGGPVKVYNMVKVVKRIRK